MAGESKLNGSKSQGVSDRTDLFVGDFSDCFGMNEKEFDDEVHLNPSNFKFESFSLFKKTNGNMAHASVSEVCKIL